MIRLFFLFAICLGACGVVNAQPVAKESAKQAQLPFIGKWRVVSQTTGGKLEVTPKNDICLSTDLLAEYDRVFKPNPLLSGPVEMASLSNVKWAKHEGIFKTCTYRSPPTSLGIDRFAEQNIAGYCYLKVSGNSAILVFSKSEIETDPFEIGVSGDSKTEKRVLSLHRIDSEPGARGHHITNMKHSITRWFGDAAEMDDNFQKVIGGFLDEQQRVKSKKPK